MYTAVCLFIWSFQVFKQVLEFVFSNFCEQSSCCNADVALEAQNTATVCELPFTVKLADNEL